MSESDQEKDQSSKLNISVGGDVKGNANIAGRDLNVDNSKYIDQSSHEETHGDNIEVGDISGSTGIAIGRNAQANVSMGGDTAEAFAAILEKLAALQQERPDIDPMTFADAQAEVEEIQEKVEEGKVDESWLERKFRTIALMGDDILEVVTATALSPALGMVTIVKKIAKKAREEAGLPAID